MYHIVAAVIFVVTEYKHFLHLKQQSDLFGEYCILCARFEIFLLISKNRQDGKGVLISIKFE